MNYFIYGLIFIFFSATLKVPFLNISVQFLPAFVGYLLIINPIKKYKKHESSFKEIEYLSIAMSLFTLIEFISVLIQFDIFNRSEWILNIITPLTTIVVPLFLAYRIIWSIRMIEEKHKYDWNTDSLVQLWTYLLIILSVNVFLNDSIFNFILTIASLLVKAWIIYSLTNTVRLAQASENEWYGIEETKI